VVQRVARGIALLFLDRGTRRGVSGQQHAPAALPLGKTRYPFYRRLGGPQGRSGRAENLVPAGTFLIVLVQNNVGVIINTVHDNKKNVHIRYNTSHY